MIEVSLPNLVLIPLVFNLAIIFACWMYYTFAHHASRAVRRSARIYRCSVCDNVYLEVRDIPLARCPRCGHNNEAIRR
jgi:rubrerythrin